MRTCLVVKRLYIKNNGRLELDSLLGLSSGSSLLLGLLASSLLFLSLIEEIEVIILVLLFLSGLSFSGLSSSSSWLGRRSRPLGALLLREPSDVLVPAEDVRPLLVGLLA